VATLSAFNFDEGTGTLAADSVGSRDITVVSPGNWEAAGHTNSAFNGAGGVRTVPSHAGLETASRTLMFWARAAGSVGSQWLVQFYITAPDTAAWGIGWIGGNLFMRARVGGVNTNLTTPIVDEMTWHHFALTYDGVTLRGYRDAVQFSSAPLTGTVDLADVVRITDTTSDLIDDLRFFDEALDQATIETFMDTPVPPEEQPSGGSAATVQVAAVGAGSKGVATGSAAGVAVTAVGAGFKAASGGSVATVVITAVGAGFNPESALGGCWDLDVDIPGWDLSVTIPAWTLEFEC
jgi:Concanavalin A-like lectin/glucanases superfamily